MILNEWMIYGTLQACALLLLLCVFFFLRMRFQSGRATVYREQLLNGSDVIPPVLVPTPVPLEPAPAPPAAPDPKQLIVGAVAQELETVRERYTRLGGEGEPGSTASDSPELSTTAAYYMCLDLMLIRLLNDDADEQWQGLEEGLALLSPPAPEASEETETEAADEAPLDANVTDEDDPDGAHDAEQPDAGADHEHDPDGAELFSAACRIWPPSHQAFSDGMQQMVDEHPGLEKSGGYDKAIHSMDPLEEIFSGDLAIEQANELATVELEHFDTHQGIARLREIRQSQQKLVDQMSTDNETPSFDRQLFSNNLEESDRYTQMLDEEVQRLRNQLEDMRTAHHENEQLRQLIGRFTHESKEMMAVITSLQDENRSLKVSQGRQG